MSELPQTIGFIGLGVMGEPMCRNLATKSGRGQGELERAGDPTQIKDAAAAGLDPNRMRYHLTGLN